MRDFPHLKNAPAFPGSGREVYEQIPGAYDSGEWTEGATITLLSVPWGVYNAETQTDVPGFDTAEERDTWFKNYIISNGHVESHVLDTLVRYQLKGTVALPFTFDYASRYNYMIVDYPAAPVQYGTLGLKRWFFHVTAIDYDSPSCTSVSITPDWWTTCAPLMTINHMILERGHAPVAASNVDTYLSAPLNNSEYLLSPDVDFGGAERVSATNDVVFNGGTVYAVVCMRGINLAGDFTDYKLPKQQVTFIDGQPSTWTCAVLASDLQTFLSNMHSQAEQAFGNIDAIYMVGSDLLNLGAATTIFGVSAWVSVAGARGSKKLELKKSDFGFDSKIADLAKLYTSPYAHLELTDESGAVTNVKVEELNNSYVAINYAFNGAYPWLKLSANLANVGGSSRDIAFKNADAHIMQLGGKWYQTLREWDVPCFSVVQSAAEAYDYQQHYNVNQAYKNAETAYNNAVASADTAYNNSTAANATAQTNANNNAALTLNNNAVTVAANTAMVTRSNNGSTLSAARANGKLNADAAADAAMSSASYSADKDALGVAATNNAANAVSTGANILATTIAAAAGGAGVGAFAGGVGAIPGAAIGGLLGLTTATMSYVTSSASNGVSQSNNSTLYSASLTNIESKRANAASYATDNTSTACNVNTDNTATTNEASTNIATNSANNVKTNAANTKTTADANADRSKFTAKGNAQRTKANAEAAIVAGVNNAGMQASTWHGVARNGAYSSTRPMILSLNVVTESKNAIAQAAAQFKRWGYCLNQTWDHKTWSLMKHFTFWQVSDVWATGTGEVPEEGQDAVRQMLYTGVTCWKDPSEIGKVTIYDN